MALTSRSVQLARGKRAARQTRRVAYDCRLRDSRVGSFTAPHLPCHSAARRLPSSRLTPSTTYLPTACPSLICQLSATTGLLFWFVHLGSTPFYLLQFSGTWLFDFHDIEHTQRRALDARCAGATACYRCAATGNAHCLAAGMPIRTPAAYGWQRFAAARRCACGAARRAPAAAFAAPAS